MTTSIYAQIEPTRLARMIEISRDLNSTTDQKQLLSTIMNEARALTGAASASIMLLDPQTRELRFKAASHGMPDKLIDMPVPIEGSIAGAILRANEPMIIDDVTQDARWHSNIDEEIDFHTESILGVPMHDRDRPVGVLEAVNKLDGAFTQEDVEILAILADLAGVAIERARLIDALTRANQRLNELDELKTNFIAIASHELRTPLSIILGYVSFLRGNADPAMAEQFDSVLNAAVRLRGLIQDMLNLGYVDTGAQQLERQQVDLVRVITDVVNNRDGTSQAKQQTLRVALPSNPVHVAADRKMLELVLSNLLNNATKFTPAGGHIRVRLLERPDEAWIAIRDSGVGIPPDKLERIFDRFYQVEHPLTRQFEGMGLGLAIAKELVALHDGRIWAASEPGQGSEFFVALPLLNGAEPA